METLIHDAEFPIIRDDCLDWLGENRTIFYTNRQLYKLRIGQAWFNALTMEDANKLVGTSFDPFHKDDWLSVIKALMFLLEN